MPFLPTVRYLVFAAFIVCNSVLASVAVWNASLSPPGRDSRIDDYIVAVGALGLVLTFTIIFAELIRRNAFTSRVWFEILWTSVFFLLDLGGASALAAVGSDDMCKSLDSQHHQTLPAGGAQECTSFRVLMGFTWLSCFILLIYLVLLVVLATVNRNNESVPRIWVCTIHNLPPLTLAGRSHAPVTPLPRFSRDKMTEVTAPAPQRPNGVPSSLYSLRSVGLGSQYQIEHFQPPAQAFPPMPSSPVASPADHLHRNPSTAGSVQAAVALYPQFLSSAYIAQPPPVRSQPSQPTVPSPPPLGDWPRADAPLRIKRKLPPTMSMAEGPPASGSRPMGPRMRSGTANAQPPPLTMRRDRERRT